MVNQTAPGWYGKLPITGDFLGQRLSQKQIDFWSHWFQQGLMHWQQQDQASTRYFLNAPVWNFILPVTPGLRQVQMGCLLPSCDRVGRAWPLLAVYTWPLSHWHRSQLLGAGDWFRATGHTLLRSVHDSLSYDALEAALHALPSLPDVSGSGSATAPGTPLSTSAPEWQEVTERFDPLLPVSYWWSNRSDGFAYATHKHSGNLTAQLFTLLFNPAAGGRSGRNGLWPPMFDQA